MNASPFGVSSWPALGCSAAGRAAATTAPPPRQLRRRRPVGQHGRPVPARRPRSRGTQRSAALLGYGRSGAGIWGPRKIARPQGSTITWERPYRGPPHRPRQRPDRGRPGPSPPRHVRIARHAAQNDPRPVKATGQPASVHTVGPGRRPFPVGRQPGPTRMLRAPGGECDGSRPVSGSSLPPSCSGSPAAGARCEQCPQRPAVGRGFCHGLVSHGEGGCQCCGDVSVGRVRPRQGAQCD